MLRLHKKLRIISSGYKAQTAVEYMLLLGVVMAIVLIGFKKYVPRIEGAGNVYYEHISNGILGNINPCGDGWCAPLENIDNNLCTIDCR